MIFLIIVFKDLANSDLIIISVLGDLHLKELNKYSMIFLIRKKNNLIRIIIKRVILIMDFLMIFFHLMALIIYQKIL